MNAQHLTHDASALLHTLRVWSYPLTLVGYYLAAAMATFDGVFRELMGHHGRHSKLHRLLWQWHTGMHVHPFRSYGDEKRLKRTASSSQRATPEGSIVYWSKWKRPHRAARANLITVAVLSTLWGLVFATEIVIVTLSVFCTVMASALLGLLVYRLRKRVAARGPRIIRTKAFVRSPIKVTEPEPTVAQGGETMARPQLIREGGVPTSVLAGLLADPIGCSTAETEKRLTVTSEEGKLVLPDHFAALTRQKEIVEEIIRNNSPGDVSFRWSTSSSPRTLAWKPVVTALPDVSWFHEWTTQMEALDIDVFGVGLNAARQMYVQSHQGDRPWALCSMNSGTGKSTKFQVKLAQICHKDPNAEVYCVDTKQVSFHDMGGIPGVHIFDDPVDNMGAIYEVPYVLTGIMKQRYKAVRTGKARVEDFSNIWLLMDEGNDFSTACRIWYEQNIKQSGDPATPKMWREAFAPLIQQGREVGIRGELMFQNMTDNALGGISLRDAFPEIGMAGFKKNQWTRIIGSKPPDLRVGPGRICMVLGPREEWVQGFYDTPKFLRDYALAGREEVAA